MAEGQNLTLYLPFDETAGSDIAYDYARNRHDAAVTKADFIAGKQSNAIHFDGNGKAEIASNFVVLDHSFTILAWVKANTYADKCTGKRIGLFCNTALLGGSRELWVDVEPESWGFFVIRKTGNAVTLSHDTKEVGRLDLPGTLTGIALLQDIYQTETAFADLYDVKFYDTFLTDAEIEQELNGVAQLEYYLDGTNLKEYGVRVESSDGILDLPKLKTPTSCDWADYHGKVVDLTAKRYEEREITLNCWLKASGKMDFTERVNRLYKVFRKDGTQRLMIAIHPTKPLLYEVYCEDGVAPSKRWRDDTMIGKFALKLKEPDPVKRVVRHQRISDATAKLSVEFKGDKMVNIYWGDGSVDYDVYGDHTGKNAITHTYTEDGIYYAVIGGVIEEMTDFNTNGILVWNKL